jgi:alkylated DNA repair protein (DNA oxidative demethylase)
MRSMSRDLFEPPAAVVPLAPGAVMLREFARPIDAALLGAVREIVRAAPFRHMQTRGGYRMSVAMSNCGSAGWITDRNGYRYDAIDPQTGLPWPAMPALFQELATHAAHSAGYPGFAPDACLINRYEPGARMSLHQDRNERDFDAPIVSVSLGLPATFLFGGRTRAAHPLRVDLGHGDVVVWGGPARLVYHGVRPLADGVHGLLGRERLNLTFRHAL